MRVGVDLETRPSRRPRAVGLSGRIPVRAHASLSRTLSVYTRSPSHHARRDEASFVHVVDAPDGVAVVNADLKKADAKLDESACQFDVAFTPSATGPFHGVMIPTTPSGTSATRSCFWSRSKPLIRRRRGLRNRSARLA